MKINKSIHIIASCLFYTLAGLVLHGQNNENIDSEVIEANAYYDGKSNMNYKKSAQLAHYPLTARIHNEAFTDNFLEVYPYDVSGNNKHGVYENISKRKIDGNGLEYPATQPFYPMYSRIKTKTNISNFPKRKDGSDGGRYVSNQEKSF